jgi:hypothetical protein
LRKWREGRRRLAAHHRKELKRHRWLR